MKTFFRTLCICLCCLFLASGCAKQSCDQAAGAPAGETLSADGSKLSADSSDFVLLSEAVPDAILELRYYSTYNFVGDRIDGYEQPVALLTREAAAALAKASDSLKAKG